jgi:radical SAM-linked protein
MMQRALIRAGIKLCYSQGFNPRPKLSLPLPRAVGVRSDCERLCAMVESGEEDLDAMRKSLAGQLPEDCEILDIRLTDSRQSYQPVTATYRISIRDLSGDTSIREAVVRIRQAVADHQPVEVERSVGAGRGIRRLDVGPYLDVIEQEDDFIHCRCRITPEGTIRIDEILNLLRIDPSRMTEPVRRESVEWKQA